MKVSTHFMKGIGSRIGSGRWHPWALALLCAWSVGSFPHADPPPTLRPGGTVLAYGNNLSGQTDVPGDATNVVAIAAGPYHNLAVRADGTVIGWGVNFAGQADAPLSLHDAVMVAGGSTFSLAASRFPGEAVVAHADRVGAELVFEPRSISLYEV